MKKIVPTFILGTIAIIFGADTIFEVFGNHATISETVTGWIGQSGAHLIIFISLVIALCVHWIWGKYN